MLPFWIRDLLKSACGKGKAFRRGRRHRRRSVRAFHLAVEQLEDRLVPTHISIPTNLVAGRGGIVQVPINVDSLSDNSNPVIAPQTGMSGATIVLWYDPSKFSINLPNDISLGTLGNPAVIGQGYSAAIPNGWSIPTSVIQLPSPGEITFGLIPSPAFGDIIGTLGGTLAVLNLHVLANAAVGSTHIDLAADAFLGNAPFTQITDENDVNDSFQPYSLIPPPNDNTGARQVLNFGGNVTGGTFTLGFNGAITTPITYSSTASVLQTHIQDALNNLSTIGRANAVQELDVGVAPPSSSNPPFSFVFTDAFGVTATSSPITYSSSPSTFQANIQHALDGLSNIGPNNSSVTADTSQIASGVFIFGITFQNALGFAPQKLLRLTNDSTQGVASLFEGFTNSVVSAANATSATVLFTDQLGGGQTFDSFTVVSSLTGTNVSLTVVSTGAPTSQFPAGAPFFGYYGSDSNDGMVTISSGSLPPVAISDNYAITELEVASDPSMVVSASGVLANDIDPQGEPLSATLISQPTHGSVSLNNDGSFTYTPNAGFLGTDSFTYNALNPQSNLTSNTATVSVYVTARLSIPTNLTGQQNNLVQQIIFDASTSGGTFTLAFNNVTTGPINFNTFASTLQASIQSALDNLSSIGARNTTVIAVTSTSKILSFNVTFNNAFANGPAIPPLLVGDGTGLQGTSPTLTVVPAVFVLGPVQTINFGPTTSGGTFTLAFKGITTSPISFGTGNTAQAILQANVQAALDGLSTIGAGNTTVDALSATSIIVTFNSSLANGPSSPPLFVGNNSGLLGFNHSLTIGAATPVNIDNPNPAGSGGLDGVSLAMDFDSNVLQFVNALPGTITGNTNAVQTITFGGQITGGTFQLGLSFETSGPITYTSNTSTLQSNIQAALNAMSSIGGATGSNTNGNSLVSAVSPSSFTVTFQGALAHTFENTFSVVNNLSGTIPTVTVTPTITGYGVWNISATANNSTQPGKLGVSGSTAHGQESTLGGSIVLLVFTVNASAPAGASSIYIVPQEFPLSGPATTSLGFGSSTTLPPRPSLQKYPTFVAGVDGVVTVSGASHFVVNAPSSATSGTPITFTVTAEDAENNTATNYSGTVTFSSSDGAAVFVQTRGTLTNGVGNFTVTLNVPGSQTLTATDLVTSSISGNSNAIAVSASGGTHLVISGVPSSITAGVPFSFTVTADDQFNNTAAGYSGTVTVTSTDTGLSTIQPVSKLLTSGVGIFTATLTTAGNQTLIARDNNTSGITGTVTGLSGAIAVSAGAATHFSVISPVSTVAGAAFSFTVLAEDTYNNTATGYQGSVTFASSDSAATFPAKGTLASGLGSFSATFQTKGSQVLSVTDILKSTLTGASNPMSVGASATHFVVTLPTSLSAGSAFAFSVIAQDEFNNTVTGYNGSIHFSSTDSAASLPLDATLTAGTSTFSATFKTAGNQSITVSALPNLISDASFETPSLSLGSFQYVPTGTPWLFAGNAGVAANNSPFTDVNQDAPDGTQVAFLQVTGSMSQSLTLSAGTYSISFLAAQRVEFNTSYQQFDIRVDGAVVATIIPPSHSFTNIQTPRFTIATSGTHTIQFVGLDPLGGDNTAFVDLISLTPTGLSNTSTVIPAAANHFVITTSGFATAGFNTQFTVTAEDPFNNADTNYSGTVHFTSSDSLALVPGIGALTNGLAVFSAKLVSPGIQTLNAVDTANSSILGISGPITVVASATTHLAINAGPSAVATGGIVAVTVSALDQFNNLVNTYFGNSTFSSSDTSAVLPHSGTLTSGVARFSATLNSAGIQTIMASNPFGSTGAISDASFETPALPAKTLSYQPSGAPWQFSVDAGLAANQSGLLDGTQLAPDGTQVAFLHNTGSISQSVTLAASAYSISFYAAQRTGSIQSSYQQIQVIVDGLPVANLTPPSVSYSQLQTPVFNVATSGTHNIQFAGLDPLGGDNTAFVDQISLTPVVVSNPIAVGSLGPASHFQIIAPSVANAGVPFQFTVKALDSFNNQVTGYTGSVGFSSTDSAASIASSGSLSNGLGIFSATLQSLGNQKLTASDSVTSSLTGASNSILVTAGPATHFAISGMPSNITAGMPFSFTVTAEDQFNNTASAYGGTVQFTSSDSQASLPGISTLMSGIGSFSATLKTAGSQTVTASGVGQSNISGISGSISVAPTLASHFAISGLPPTITAGMPFSFTVTAKDPFNNTATSYSGTVTFTSTDKGIATTLPISNSLISGVGAFIATLTTAGSQTLIATDNNTSGITGTVTGLSGAVAVSAGAASHFSVSAPATVVPGTTFNFSVLAQDAYNNKATSYQGTVAFANSDSAAVFPVKGTLASGLGSFSATFQTRGSQLLSATDVLNGTFTGSSNPVIVSYLATHFVVTAPADPTAGSAFTFTVAAEDQFNSTALGYSGTVHFVSSDSQAILPPDSSIANGAGVFTATLMHSGNQTITASGVATTLSFSQISISPLKSTVGLGAGVAIGDLNGDGKNDFVFVNNGLSNVAVYLGNGNGTFASGVIYPVGTSPENAVIADFNGDGIPDLAVANAYFSSASVSILLGCGDGTFGPTTNYGVGGAAGLDVGDLNGDGRLDLAVGHGSNPGYVAVFLGNGNGTFQKELDTSSDNIPDNIALGDLNHDGKLDVVVANYSNTFISVQLGNGDGTFQAAHDYTVGHYPFGMVLSDFNGDGKLDLATANLSDSSISVLLANGDGTFQTSKSYSADVDSGIMSGDLNGDGEADLIISSGQFSAGTLSVRLGAGDGTFGANQVIGAFAGITGVALGDLNGDGAADVLLPGAISGKIVVLSNQAFVATGSVFVRPAAASQFALSATAAAPLNSPLGFTVTAFDIYKNVATSYAGTALFSSSDANAVFTPSKATLTSGTGVFSVSFAALGSQTLMASDAVSSSITGSSNAIIVSGPATYFVFSGPSNLTAGSPFRFTVTALDVNNATALGYIGSVHFTSGDSLGTMPADALLSSGVGAFSATLATAGTQTLTATDSLVSSVVGTSDALAISPGPTTHFTVDGVPTNITAGTIVNFSVTAFDQFNNTAVGYSHSVYFSSTDTGASLPLDSALMSGTGVFSATLVTAGTQTVTASQAGSNTDAISLSTAPSGFPIPNASIMVLTSPGGVGTGNVIPFALDGMFMKASSESATSVTLVMDMDFIEDRGNFDDDITIQLDLQPDGTVQCTCVGREDAQHGYSLLGSNGQVLVGDFQPGSGTFVFPTTNVGFSDGSPFTLSYTNPAANPSTGTATVTFSTSAATLQSNIQAALSTGGLATQIGIGPGGIPRSVVMVTNDSSIGANVLVTFQGSLEFATNQLLSSTTSGVTITQVTNSPPSTISGTSSTIAVSHAELAKLGFQVPAAATAGVGFVATVLAEDAYNNPVTEYGGTAVLSSSDTTATFVPESTTLTNGSGTFSAILTTAGSQTLTASSDTGGPAGTLTGNSVAVSVNAAPATHLSFSAPAVPVTITLKSDASTLGATIGQGIPSQSQLSRLDTPNIAGLTFVPVVLGVAGTGMSPPPGSPAGTVVVSIPPGDGENGYFETTFTLPAGFSNIQLSGAADTDDLGRVFLNGNPITPSLLGNDPKRTTRTGNATFQTQNASFFNVGQNALLISDANTGGSPSGGIFFVTITYYQTVVSTPVPAGTPLVFTVTAQDQFNNTALSYNGSVQFTSNDNFATLPANRSLVSGIAIFSATLKTAGNQVVTATDVSQSSISGSSAPVSISPLAATHFAIGLPSTVATAGAPFSFTVTAEDKFNNTATGYSGSVAFSKSDSGVSSALPGSNSLLNGVGTFTATLTTAGSQTLTATDNNTSGITGTITGKSSAVTVNAAAAAHFAVSAPGIAAAQNAIKFTVTAFDSYNNLASGYNGTVGFSSNDSGAVFVPTSSTLGNGSGVFSAIFSNSGSQTLTATDTSFGNISGTSNAISVTGPVTHFAIGPPATSTISITLKSDATTLCAGFGAGAASQGMLSRLDTAELTGLTFGPVLVGAQGTGMSAPPGSPVSTSVVSITPGDGESGYFESFFTLPAGFTNIQLTGSANTDDLGRVFLNGNAISPSLLGSDSNRITRLGNATFQSQNASQFNVGQNILLISDANTGGPSGAIFFFTVTYIQSFATAAATAGTPLIFTVTAQDQFNNTALGYNGSVAFSSSDMSASLPTTAILMSGIAVVSATLKTSGSQIITTNDAQASSITGMSDPIAVVSGPMARLVVLASPNGTTAGRVMLFTVTSADAFGNLAASFSGPIGLASSDSVGVLPVNGSIISGVGVFTATLRTAGNQIIVASASPGTVTFVEAPGSPIPLPSQLQPDNETVGDLNGDGILDLVVQSIASPTASILLGNGYGTFRNGGSVVLSSTVGNPGPHGVLRPGPVIISDFNGDGKPDLAVASSYNRPTVLLGNGDGTFGPATPAVVYNGTVKLAEGDFDNDGIPDLVFTTGTDHSILETLGNGNGTFGHLSTLYFAPTFLHDTLGIGIADFNHDGNQDIAFSDEAFNSIGVLFGNGDGTFQPAIFFSAGVNGGFIQIGDFNSDGILDIATLSPFQSLFPNFQLGNTVSVLLGTAAGAFQPGIVTTLPGPTKDFAVADYNGDGKLDIFATDINNNKLTVLQGNGDGTFSTAQRISVGRTPQPVAVADFNGDGSIDLAVGNANDSTVSILVNQKLTASVTVPVTPAASDHFVVSAPSVVSAGTAFQLTVTSKDPFNNTATSYLGTVHFTGGDIAALNPGDGVLNSGVGIFSASLVSLGGQTLTATDTAIASIAGTSKKIVVVAGSATHLSVNAVPNSISAGGSVFLTVTAWDQFNNTATGYSGNIMFSSGDAAATLPTTSVLASGASSFSATLKTVGNQTLTVADAQASTITGASVVIVVTPDQATHFIFSPFSNAFIAGNTLAFTVTALDAFNTLVPGYVGTVTFTSSDTGVSTELPGSSTLSGGTGTFMATLTTAGNQTLIATDPNTSVVTGNVVGISGIITVSADVATHLSVPAPTGAVLNVPFNFTVLAQDRFDNRASGYSATVNFSSSDTAATLPSAGIVSNGAGVFTATLASLGSQTLSTVDNQATNFTATSNNIVVTLAPASHFVLNVSPNSITAGNAVTVTVTALDQLNHTATDYNGTVTFSSSDSGASTLLPAGKLINGVGTFTATLTTAGSQTLFATDKNTSGITGTITGSSSVITVSAATATHFAINTPSNVTARTAFNFTVTAQDQFGNISAGYGGTVTITCSGSGSLFTQGGRPVTSAVLTSGVGLFAAILKQVGNQTVTVIDNNSSGITETISGQSGAIAVSAGTGTYLAVSTPTIATAGSGFTLTVSALDFSDNPVTNYTGKIQFQSSDSSSSIQLPAAYTFTAADLGQHVFTGGVSLVTAGMQIVTVVDSAHNTITGTSNSIAVSPQNADHLVVVAPTAATAGIAFSVTLTATDHFNNKVPNYGGTVALSAAGDSLASFAPGSGTLTNGVGVFSVTLTRFTAASFQPLTISGSGVTGALAFVSVSANIASQFKVTASAHTVEGSGFGVTVIALDLYGNLDLTYGNLVTLSDGSSNTSVSQTLSNGTGVVSMTLDTPGSRILSASDTNINGASDPITITAATHFVLAAATPQTAGSGFAFTVTAQDDFGDTDALYGGTATFSSSDSTALFVPAATTLTSGSGVFSAVLHNAGSQTLTASDGTINGQGDAINVQPGATAQLAVFGPATATAGTAFVFTVQAEDAYGNATPGYHGVVGFAASGASGLPIGNTLTSGVGTFSATLYSAGSQTLTASDVAASSIAGTGVIAVSSSTATHFVIVAPTAATAGTAFVFTVAAEDAFNNTATSYNGTVVFSGGDSATALPAASPLISGVGVFSATLAIAGNRILTATDAATNTLTGVSNTITLSAASPSHFVISAAAAATAGSTLRFTVTAEDQFNNTATGYDGTVLFSTSAIGFSLPQGSTLVSGVGTFSATLNTAGSQTLTATDNNLASLSGFSNPIAVSAAAATHFAVTASIAATAGVGCGFTVTAEDAFNNTAISFDGTATFTSSDSHAALPSSGIVSSGRGVFSATLVTAGGQSLTASDAHSTVTGTGDAVSVHAALASHFLVSAPDSANAGLPVSVTVQALDPYNNAATDYSGKVTLASSDASATLAPDSTLSSGVGDFSVTLATLGTQSVTATDTSTGSITGVSGAITVSQPPATHFTITTGNATATAGVAILVTVTALDQFNQIAVDYSGLVSFSSSDGAALLPDDSALPGGQETFSVTLVTAGGQSLIATDGALNTGSLAVTVVPNIPAGFLIAGPDFAVTNHGFLFTVTAADQFGNPTPAYHGTVTFSASDTATGSLPANAVLNHGQATFSATLFNVGAQVLTATDTVDQDITGSATIAVPVTVSIPGFTSGRGQTITVPIQVNALNDPASPLQQLGLSGGTFVLYYNPSVFNVDLDDPNTVQLGTIASPSDFDPTGTEQGDGYSPSSPNGWRVSATLVGAGNLVVTLSNISNGLVYNTGGGTLATVNFTVRNNAPLGSSVVDLAADVEGGQPFTSISDTLDNIGNVNAAYDLLPAPQDNTTLSPYSYNGADQVDGVIIITGVNLPPVVANDSYQITERETASDPSLNVSAPGLLSNDSDPQFLPLTANLYGAGPAHGTVALNADGSFIYTPNASYLGTDSFRYQVSDGAHSVVGTVSLTVTSRLSIPTNLSAQRGDTITVPVNLDNPNPTGSGGLLGATVALAYDPGVLTFVSAQAGPNYPTAGNQWQFSTIVGQSSGQPNGLLAVSLLNTTTPLTPNLNTASSTLVLLTFTVAADAPDGPTPLNIMPFNTPLSGTVVTALTPANAGYAMPVRPTPTLGSDDPGVDGNVTITGAATHFLVEVPGRVVSGNAFAVTVVAEDQFNNVVTDYFGSVKFASSDPQSQPAGSAPLAALAGAITNGVGIFSVTLMTAGNQTLTVTDSDSASISGSASVQVTRGLMVSSVTPTPSGFTVTFDRPFDPSSVSMYTADATPDDVVLATSNTQVSIRGSLLFSADDTSMTFVKTATPIATGPFNPGQALLSPGNYTLTLRSYTALPTGGGTGFRDLLGNPLDGTPKGKAGSNYVVTFAVGAAPVAVGIPDFARGPSNTDALYFSTALHEGSTFNLSYTNHGSTGTATIAFSSNATTLTNNIQQALKIGGLSSQIGIDAGGVAGAVVVVTNDTKTGANALITFQGALATTTSQLLTSSTPGVNISTATINVPNNQPNSGIPIAISNAQNVTSGTFTLQYNPSLLTISGVASKLTVAGATFTMVSNDSTTGTVVLSLSSPKRLSIVGTAITLGSLLATMPLSATAAYGAKQLLHFSQVQLAGTGGTMAATAVDAVQVASYFGDTLGLGGPLSLNDAAAILRVASGVVNRPQTTIPGFAAYPNLDPVIIGDVAIQGNINAADAGALGQESNGLLKITIPLAPIGLSVAPLGPDPTLSVPNNLEAVPGSTLVVPVNIDTAHPDGSTGMVDAVLALTYDPNVLEVSAADVKLGSVPTGSSGWQLRTEVNAHTGLIGVELHSNTPIDSTVGGSLITVTMHVRGEMPVGTPPLTLVPYVDPSGSQRVYQTQVSDSRSAFVLEFATNAARTADVPITAVVENPIALAVLEQVFGEGLPFSTIGRSLTAYSPSAILASESGDRSHPDIRDLAVLQAPASTDRAEEWLIENGSASLGQSPPRGRLDSAIDLADDIEAKSNHPDRVWWDEEKL